MAAPAVPLPLAVELDESCPTCGSADIEYGTASYIEYDSFKRYCDVIHCRACGAVEEL